MDWRDGQRKEHIGLGNDKKYETTAVSHYVRGTEVEVYDTIRRLGKPRQL